MKNYVQPGDNLTFLESELVHPTHTDGLVDSGDPVVVGRIVGVSNQSAAATTDNVVVSTRGVFNLAVASVHNGLSKGETVFVDPSTGVLSDDLNDTPFGVALDTVSAGATTTIPVRLFGATPGATGYFS